jgi:ribose/xylose/arabinose/galactoside ABC-type transport system permease subunit
MAAQTTSAGGNSVTPFNRRWLPFTAWEATLLVLLGIVLLGFGVGAPGFYDGAPALLGMTENFLPFGIVTLGLAVVILTGGIDLSVGATASLCAVAAAQAWSVFGLNIWVAALLGLGLGAILGGLNALIIVRLRIEPLIATLGTSFIYASAAVAAAGNLPPSGFPGGFVALGEKALTVGGIAGLIPYQLLLFTGLVLAFWLLVSRSAFGRKLVMVGYNSEGARYSGVRVNRIIVSAYVISGLTASMAGLVLASYYDAVRPDMGDALLLTAITMVVLGGVSIFGGEGTMLGVVLAVLVLGFLRQGMLIAGFSDMVTTMSTGAILLTSIAVKNLFNPRETDLMATLRAAIPWVRLTHPAPR